MTFDEIIDELHSYITQYYGKRNPGQAFYLEENDEDDPEGLYQALKEVNKVSLNKFLDELVESKVINAQLRKTMIAIDDVSSESSSDSNSPEPQGRASSLPVQIPSQFGLYSSKEKSKQNFEFRPVAKKTTEPNLELTLEAQEAKSEVINFGSVPTNHIFTPPKKMELSKKLVTKPLLTPVKSNNNSHKEAKHDVFDGDMAFSMVSFR